jgi:hypothetical protein
LPTNNAKSKVIIINNFKKSINSKITPKTPKTKNSKVFKRSYKEASNKKVQKTKVS